LSAVTWNGNGNDNLWNDGKNWSSGSVPQSTDDVTISAAAGTTIQVATTSVTINSLTTNAAISVASGITFSSPTISASANFILAGGTLKGATLTLTGGAELVASASRGALNGVTVDGVLDLTQALSAQVTIENNLTLNGTAYVGNAVGTTSGGIFFANSQTLSGTGTVIFGTNLNNLVEVEDSSATLTIGAGITFKGTSGTIEGQFSNATIINQGTISADDSGGTPGSFQYDTDYSGGFTEETATPINTSGVANPPPQAVYQTDRYGNSFTYTIPNLTPESTYKVQLDFADFDATSVGQRLMNVSINGTPELADFDIVKSAGGPDKAVAEPITVIANSNGQIVINFSTVSGSQYPACINGIEVNSGNTQVLAIDAGDFLAIGGMTVAGGPGGGTVLNQGTFESSNGETLTVDGLSGNLGVATLSGTGTILALAGSYSVNDDLTATAGQTLRLYGAWTNESTVTATSATLALGDFTSSSNVWSNDGTVTAANSTVNLGGLFTLAGMGTFNHTNDTINLVGTLNNTGTLALDPATGSWNLVGGTVQGGIVSESGGAELFFTSSGGSLSGVTFNGNMDLTHGRGEVASDYADIENDLTLNGTAYLGNAAGTGFAELYFTNTETLSGTGTFVFGPLGGTANIIQVNSQSTTLTIDSEITIDGSSGTIQAVYTSDTIINLGTIRSDNSGGAAGSFVYDTDYSGGTTFSTASSIDTSGVTNPAPQAVYQTQRVGSFTYTLPGLIPGASYTGRLDFAELQDSASGEREFNVNINGTSLLTDFDIFKTAGAEDKAVAEPFAATANASGQIVITFTGVVGIAAVNGIELSFGSTQVLAINAGELLTAGAIAIESGGTFIDEGPILATNGAKLSISGSVNINDPGYLAMSSSETISISGSLLGNTHNASFFQVAGALSFDGFGTSSSPQLLEVMSDDLGPSQTGFSNNFDYGSLSLSGTDVELVDHFQNSGGSGPEALYVNSLIVPKGNQLNLNGLHVYAKSAQINGTTLNGTVDQVPTVAAADVGGTYNGNPYPATGSATDANGNGVTGTLSFAYYVGTSATGTGSSTAPTNAGTYTVVASFTSGNPSYGNAQSAPLTFTINPAVPTVVASDPSGLFTGNPFTATATVTGVGGATLSGGNLAFTYYVGSTVSGNGSTTAPTSIGTYTVVAGFTSTDTNYVAGPTDSQPVTFVIAKAPAFTSPNKVSFAVGVNSSFTLTASGYPASSFAITAGTLPQGLSLTPAGVLSGMPASGTAGRSTLTISASDGFGTNATQTFTLTVTATSSAPAITSANQATFTIGTSGKFTVKVTGSPTPTLGLTGTLPKGLTFDPATGVLSGKPGAGTEGTHTLTFTATNGIGTPVSQTFTLTIDQVPKITSANTATFVVGQSGKFTVKANGFPKPTFIESGSLPTGVTFNTTTGVLSGIPAAGTANSYSVTFTATNAAGDSAPQSFTLVVSNAPLAAVVPSSGPSPFGTSVGPTSLSSTTIVQATASVAPIEAAAASSSGPNAVSASAANGSSANSSAANDSGVNNPRYPFGSQMRDAIEADVDSEAIQWVGVSAAVEILNA